MNEPTKMYLENIDMLLDTYAPLKRINKYKLKSKSKDFERNWNSINNTWEGIKSLLSLKTVASSVPTMPSLDNGDTITNLSNETSSILFLHPTDKEEIVNIISSLNANKVPGPNSISYRIDFF